MWFASKEQCALDETRSVQYTWIDGLTSSKSTKGSLVAPPAALHANSNRNLLQMRP